MSMIPCNSWKFGSQVLGSHEISSFICEYSCVVLNPFCHISCSLVSQIMVLFDSTCLHLLIFMLLFQQLMHIFYLGTTCSSIHHDQKHLIRQSDHPLWVWWEEYHWLDVSDDPFTISNSDELSINYQYHSHVLVL